MIRHELVLALPICGSHHMVDCVWSLQDMRDITLAVLAGGAGARMGFPKQHLQIANRPVLEYLIERLAWAGPTLLVTTPGRERPPGSDRFDTEAVDEVADQGPLRGVLTAMEHAHTCLMVIVTVDMPAVEQVQLRWCVERLSNEPELDGLMLERNVDGIAQIEPFPFACRRQGMPMIEAQLAAGRRSVHSLSKMPGFAIESAPAEWPAHCWTNLNFPEDYRLFSQTFQG